MLAGVWSDSLRCASMCACSAGLPPEKKIKKNNVNNMQNIGTKVL